MPSDRQPLTPERLAQLLEKLNDVMGEAARLRREVTRQLAEQRHSVEQKLTPPRRRAKKVR
jgi:hypothetical protein